MSNYTDIDLTFGLNIKNDIARKYDEKSISQSIKNIVMIRHKYFQPGFGANVYRYLFSPQDMISLNNLRDEIEIAIRKNEPRIANLMIKMVQNLDENRIEIGITYTMKYSKTNYNSVVFLKFLK